MKYRSRFTPLAAGSLALVAGAAAAVLAQVSQKPTPPAGSWTTPAIAGTQGPTGMRTPDARLTPGMQETPGYRNTPGTDTTPKPNPDVTTTPRMRRSPGPAPTPMR